MPKCLHSVRNVVSNSYRYLVTQVISLNIDLQDFHYEAASANMYNSIVHLICSAFYN